MTRLPLRHATQLGLMLALAAPAAAAAQRICLPAADMAPSGEVARGGVVAAATAGAVRYALAGDRTTGGFEAGLEAATRAGRLRLGGGLYRVLLSGAPADPTAVRIRGSARLLELGGMAVCGNALAGASVVSSGDDRSSTLAGGVGAVVGTGLSAGPVILSPYVGIRFLGARTSGEILEREIGATGGSLGVEAGLGAAAGSLDGALHFTADRFDPALGATPFPALALRLALGWRF